jgi:hypothetical protein
MDDLPRPVDDEETAKLAAGIGADLRLMDAVSASEVAQFIEAILWNGLDGIAGAMIRTQFDPAYGEILKIYPEAFKDAVVHALRVLSSSDADALNEAHAILSILSSGTLCGWAPGLMKAVLHESSTFQQVPLRELGALAGKAASMLNSRKDQMPL